MHQLDPLVPSRIFLTNGGAVVGRAVVDQNQLEVLKALSQNGFHAFADVVLHIVEGNDDTDFRLHLLKTSFL
ncbi:hypothetical protein D3C71_1814850 [compost metagenome]